MKLEPECEPSLKTLPLHYRPAQIPVQPSNFNLQIWRAGPVQAPCRPRAGPVQALLNCVQAHFLGTTIPWESTCRLLVQLAYYNTRESSLGAPGLPPRSCYLL